MNPSASANLYLCSYSHAAVRWHSDDEFTLGSEEDRRLSVSITCGSTVFQKLRKSSDKDCLPILITLDHGDVPVMDGLTQSECQPCTETDIGGERLNVACLWTKNHSASCPFFEPVQLAASQLVSIVVALDKL